MTNTKLYITSFLILLLLAGIFYGCSQAEKGYQEHGWAKVVSGTENDSQDVFSDKLKVYRFDIIDSVNDDPCFEIIDSTNNDNRFLIK